MTQHIVKAGDTYSEIALKYGVSQENLQKWNRTPAKKLQIGQTIFLSDPNEIKSEQQKSNTSTHVIERGDTLWEIARDNGTSVDTLKAANPNVNPEALQLGQKINLPTSATPEVKSQSTNTQTKTTHFTQPSATKNSSSLAAYNRNVPEEVKQVKTMLKEAEGKMPSAYIAPEGKVTIGYGHLIDSQDKPSFLSSIENLKVSPKRKQAVLEKMLKTPAYQKEMQTYLQKELTKAANNTGITGVNLSVGDDLKLTDEQMELLLNSDIKSKQKDILRTINKSSLDAMTPAQKAVLIDLSFNIGSLKAKAPKLVEALNKKDFESAQVELMFSKSDGKRLKGLINRSIIRMAKFGNGRLSPQARQVIAQTYNAYRAQERHG